MDLALCISYFSPAGVYFKELMSFSPEGSKLSNLIFQEAAFLLLELTFKMPKKILKTPIFWHLNCQNWS